MTNSIKEDYEYHLFENEYYKKRMARDGAQFQKVTQQFSAAMSAEVETLIEEEQVIFRKILRLEDKLLNDQNGDNKKEPDVKKKTENPNLKKTFRDIAKKAHPDKLGDLEEDEKQKKEELFKKAQSSFENDDIEKLIEVAKELEIEPPEPDEHQVEMIKQSTKKIKKELSIINDSVAWQWSLSKGEKKDSILLNYMAYLYKNFKDKV